MDKFTVRMSWNYHGVEIWKLLVCFRNILKYFYYILFCNSRRVPIARHKRAWRQLRPLVKVNFQAVSRPSAGHNGHTYIYTIYFKKCCKSYDGLISKRTSRSSHNASKVLELLGIFLGYCLVQGHPTVERKFCWQTLLYICCRNIL